MTESAKDLPTTMAVAEPSRTSQFILLPKNISLNCLPISVSSRGLYVDCNRAEKVVAAAAAAAAAATTGRSASPTSAAGTATGGAGGGQNDDPSSGHIYYNQICSSSPDSGVGDSGDDDRGGDGGGEAAQQSGRRRRGRALTTQHLVQPKDRRSDKGPTAALASCKLTFDDRAPRSRLRRRYERPEPPLITIPTLTVGPVPRPATTKTNPGGAGDQSPLALSMVTLEDSEGSSDKKPCLFTVPSRSTRSPTDALPELPGYETLDPLAMPPSRRYQGNPEPVPLAARRRWRQPELTLLNLSSADLDSTAMKGWPLLFHHTHSDNIQLSLDRRRAKRFESFCKGICFSNRPVAINERVYLKFSEVSTSWSGVVRFGFTSHDPATLAGADLPRYACPDLTNKPGYWAKAVPERFAEQRNTLHFLVTRNGDVMYGLNNEDKGLFFSGVNTGGPLWALVDIYGNSTSMEFVDGRQLNNLSPSSGVPAVDGSVSPEMMQAYASMRLQQPSAGLSPSGHSQSMPSLPAAGAGGPLAVAGGAALPVRFYNTANFTAMPFHATKGRNVCHSTDRIQAVRLVEEYCNGYVFTSRPLRPGERMVIQILAVDTAYVGGLAFGMTACDPVNLDPEELPDDSDLLLDRPEYWVVNKDVCSGPEIGDELSFHLTDEGEVRYGKNGHHIGTLMHVDKTLPLWAFFDVYGNTQRIKSIGTVSGHLAVTAQHRASIGSGSGLTVALPPPRQTASQSPSSLGTPSLTSSSSPSTTTTITPPPRPPPPRNSPSTRHASSAAAGGGRGESPTPPTLPPKQFRPLPAPPPPPGTILQPMPALSAVPPAVQLSKAPPSHHGAQQQPPPRVAPRPLTFPPPQTAAVAAAASLTPPPPASSASSTTSPTMATPARSTLNYARLGGDSMEADWDEAKDNASNECSVCFENAVDCVLYTCGHMCLCYDCAVDIKQHQSALCPICRQAIKDIIKIYRS